MRPPGSPEELQRRRVRAIAMLKDGTAPVDVARAVGVDRRSVRRWRASFEREGQRGLSARPAPGRPPKLDATLRRKVERHLIEGARKNGFTTDLWTCPRIAELIRRRYGIRYHEDHIGRLLRSMGWSPQRPEKRARERDEEGIQRWVKVIWRRVKKTPRA